MKLNDIAPPSISPVFLVKLFDVILAIHLKTHEEHDKRRSVHSNLIAPPFYALFDSNFEASMLMNAFDPYIAPPFKGLKFYINDEFFIVIMLS